MDAVIAVFVRVGAAFGYFDWTSGKQIKKCHFVYSICCRIPGSMKTLPGLVPSQGKARQGQVQNVPVYSQ
jgi:hypothetical protein